MTGVCRMIDRCVQDDCQCAQKLATASSSSRTLWTEIAHYGDLLLGLADPSPCAVHNKHAEIPGVGLHLSVQDPAFPCKCLSFLQLSLLTPTHVHTN